MTALSPLHIIGAGLAGCEAAWQAARAGCRVILHEMRPLTTTAVHQTDGFAELVCSNSLRNDDAKTSAIGLLHAEMRCAGSLIMAAADAHKLPAGTALAVDRHGFSAHVGTALANHPRIEIRRGEIKDFTGLTGDAVIVATGPLTSPALAQTLAGLTGDAGLAFFDAIAPIIYRDSIDMTVAWAQSRYDKGQGDDYINCPLNRIEYHRFVTALLEAEKKAFHDWETQTPYFDGCLPVEVMAGRGPETLRHGPMKPVGLTNAHDPANKPYAVVQLRQDNASATLYNMVGFQTKLKHDAQLEVFRRIPGLENARFARLGGLHRNTFLNSPAQLDGALRLKALPKVRFAGQITGVEGYVESAATGLVAGRLAAAEKSGARLSVPPPTTAHGALIAYITGKTRPPGRQDFQPMNINFGLMPPPDSEVGRTEEKPANKKRKRALQRELICERALMDFKKWNS